MMESSQLPRYGPGILTIISRPGKADIRRLIKKNLMQRYFHPVPQHVRYVVTDTKMGIDEVDTKPKTQIQNRRH